jgi:hypothetical protein
VIRRFGAVASSGIFVIINLVLSLSSLRMAVWDQFPDADEALYRSRNFGLSAGYLFLMSVPAAVGFGVTLAVSNAWGRARNHRPLAAPWIPIAAAALAVGLEYTELPKVLLSWTDVVFGPDSMWMLVTWPFGQAVLATGMCVAAANVWGRVPAASSSA